MSWHVVVEFVVEYQGLTEIGSLQTDACSLFLETEYFSPPYFIFPTIFIQVTCAIISQDNKVKPFWERDASLGKTHANGCTYIPLR